MNLSSFHWISPLCICLQRLMMSPTNLHVILFVFTDICMYLHLQIFAFVFSAICNCIWRHLYSCLQICFTSFVTDVTNQFGERCHRQTAAKTSYLLKGSGLLSSNVRNSSVKADTNGGRDAFFFSFFWINAIFLILEFVFAFKG